MTIPFNLPLNSVLVHNGQRRLRFEGHLGDEFLSIKDMRTAGPLQIREARTGALCAPTFEWVLEEFSSGRLKVQRPTIQTRSGRIQEVSGLDASACAARDPKSPWRLRWAIAAMKAGLTRTDEEYAKFIAENRSAIFSDQGFDPPAASSLRRHVRKLETAGASTSVFVSGAGRPKGHSQLPAAEDILVDDIALRYWATPEWLILCAWAVMFAEWEDLVAAGVEGLSQNCPTYEALRLRIRKLETYETVLTKHGKEAADRKFKPSGTSVPTTRPFERVFMDGTELEQIATFGPDLEIAGSKVKAVILADDFSTYVFPPVVFPGPYREEMGTEALIRMMSPPTNIPDEILEIEPHAAWVFGRPTTIVPDNDRTLIPPGYIPALTELGPEIDLPTVYHSDAKARLEGFFPWLKRRLAGLPGTVRSPRLRKDIRHDPVAEAELTIHQIRTIVERLIWEHNTTPKAELGYRTPLELMVSYLLAGGGPKLGDAYEPRRALAKTHEGRTLTKHGLLFDGIMYRSPEMGDVLKDNLADTPIAERLSDSAKCTVSIRTFESDLDKILVFNSARGEFVELFSTEPTYTGGLSRWEHAEYRKLARERGEKFQNERQRCHSRLRSLEFIAKEAPSLPFRQRKNLAALLDCEVLRSKRGRAAQQQMPYSSDGILSQLRRKAEGPPPGPKNQQAGAVPEAFASATRSNQNRVGKVVQREPARRDWNQVGANLDDDMDLDS